MNNKHIYIAKTKEEAINQAISELNCKEEDIIVIEKEKKQGIFGNKKIEIEAYKKNDIINEVNDFLISTTKLMGIETQIEIKIRDNTINMRMFSDHNPILIGKDGQTLSAFQTIIKQMMLTKYNIKLNIILDVENYKSKQNKNLEFLAKRTAKEVSRTKIEAKMDPMNSYQRRIVHNAISKFEDVYTESVGKEPNRCIVIKPKED